MSNADLLAALAKANTELTNPKKDAKADAGQYSYKYATLDSILAHVRPILAAHGLSIVQDVQITDHKVAVTTYLMHASGDWLTFGPLTGPAGSSWQQVGGGITYARRYALTAALGIAADEDTDAQWPAVPKSTPAVKASPAGVKVPGGMTGPAKRAWTTAPATDDQRKFLGRLVRELGYANTVEFLSSPRCHDILGGPPSSPLVKGHASELIDALTEGRDTVEAPRDDQQADEQILGEEYEANR